MFLFRLFRRCSHSQKEAKSYLNGEKERDEKRGEEKQRGKLSQISWTLWRAYPGFKFLCQEIKNLEMTEMTKGHERYYYYKQILISQGIKADSNFKLSLFSDASVTAATQKH